MRHMSRRTKEREWIKVTFPVKTPLYHSYVEIDSYSRRELEITFHDLHANRSFAGYQPGEFLLFYEFGTKERIRLARVVEVTSEKNRHEEYIPVWRVQVVNKNGMLSQNWKRVYPGDIYRAHFYSKAGGKDGPDQRRSLPENMDNGWIDV